VFIQPLPSNDRRDTHTETEIDRRDKKYAVVVDSGAMIYIPNFTKLGLGINRLIWGDSHTVRQY
jgi:hypothetical protein